MSTLQGQFDGLGEAPRLENARAHSATLVRLMFNEQMQVDVTLQSTGSYLVRRLSDSALVPLASVEVPTNSLYVLLHLTTELQESTDYEVEVVGAVTDLVGNSIDPAHTTATFRYTDTTTTQPVAPPEPQTPPVSHAHGRLEFLLPTATDVLLYVNDVLVHSRRRGTDADIQLPSLRTRAKLLVQETELLAVHHEDE